MSLTANHEKLRRLLGRVMDVDLSGQQMQSSQPGRADLPFGFNYSGMRIKGPPTGLGQLIVQDDGSLAFFAVFCDDVGGTQFFFSTDGIQTPGWWNPPGTPFIEFFGSVAINPGVDFVEPRREFAGAGAFTQRSGLLVLTGGAPQALTIPNPIAGTYLTGGDDGKILTIISRTAQAHTLNNGAGAGFNGGGAGSDLATWGGAIGDGMTIIADNGVWLVQSLRNVTLS